MSILSRLFRRSLRRGVVCVRLPAQLAAAHGTRSKHGYGRIIRDLTMPDKDWARLASQPAKDRRPAKIVLIKSEPFIPAFLQRQAD